VHGSQRPHAQVCSNVSKQYCRVRMTVCTLLQIGVSHLALGVDIEHQISVRPDCGNVAILVNLARSTDPSGKVMEECDELVKLDEIGRVTAPNLLYGRKSLMV
jgi:hypothetical protein